ncbi:MAG: DUF1476 domain-containing protein [Alphaproteobacteria bacterium]|nr:DUF1476 domain-containing protein [Alphaproteobacteria bacterium]
MTMFDEREKASENKWKHDQELRFKIMARRNKLLGQWVAGKLGLTGTAAQDYAKAVVIADLDRPGDDDVVEKVMADIKAKGLPIEERKIRKKLIELVEDARKQVMAE